MTPSELHVDLFMTRSPHRIEASASLAKAHELMREHRIRHLPVTRNGDLVGLLSMGDLHLIETLHDVDPDQVLVEEAMSHPPYVVPPDAMLDEVVAHMAASRLGSAIVAERGQLVGIFTTIDALHALLSSDFLSRIRG